MVGDLRWVRRKEETWMAADVAQGKKLAVKMRLARKCNPIVERFGRHGRAT